MNNDIYIIGAGVSGLVAAIELEQAGLSPVILERSDSVGGRVKTDIVNGIPFDHGFQVLLTAYPAAKQYLDYSKLDLQTFVPGASIYRKGQAQHIGDPRRYKSLLFSSLFASVGKLSDKFKILQLANQLRKWSIEDIFSQAEKPTLSFLREYGFSDLIIESFFRPFFSGIFLEPDLATSHRMFLFTYKMFGSGLAAVPAAGMRAIPDQLAGKLQQTEFRFNTEVAKVEEGKITLADGSILKSDLSILACNADLIPGRKKQTKWNGVTNLYFEIQTPRSDSWPIIGLLPEAELVNNIHYFSGLLTTGSQKEVLSVSILGTPDIPAAELVDNVRIELQEHAGIEAGECLRIFKIPKRTPAVDRSEI